MQINLFEKSNSENENLLPFDGVLKYFGVCFNAAENEYYFNRLMTEINWKNDEAFIFGKHYITDRKVAWYAEKPISYTYSRKTKTSEIFTPLLLELKQKIEEITGLTFNSCLLNLYHNGNEGMAWHSDDEKELAKHYGIVSLSFGAERKFSIKHKTKGIKKDILLENGSLLLMAKEMQDFWLHRLPITKKISKPRINLTFRLMK